MRQSRDAQTYRTRRARGELLRLLGARASPYGERFWHIGFLLSIDGVEDRFFR